MGAVSAPISEISLHPLLNSIGEEIEMASHEKIRTSKELEFAVFCIENVAQRLGVDAEGVYDALTKKVTF